MSLSPGESDIHAFVDDLDADQTARLADLLERPDRDRLSAYLRQKLLLNRLGRALERPPASAATLRMADAVAAALRRPRLGLGAGAAAAAVLALLGVALASGSSPAQARDYYGYEGRAEDIVVEPAHGRALPVAADLTERLSAWMGRPVRAPDLSRHGLRLKRAVLLESGRVKYLGLAYEGGAMSFTLCVSPDADGLIEPVEYISAGPVKVGYWSDGRRAFAVIDDRGSRGLPEIVRLVAAAPPAGAS